MAIPAFDGQGVLPAGPCFVDFQGEPIFAGHAATITEIEDRFVDCFPQSHTRPALFRELQRLHRLARKSLDCMTVLVSGEFVTNRETARDIHVILEVRGHDLDSLDSDAQWLLHRIFHSLEYKYSDEDLTVNTGIVRAYPPGHANFEISEAERSLARLQAGSPIPDIDGAGYVEYLDCEGGWDNVSALAQVHAEGDGSSEAD